MFGLHPGAEIFESTYLSHLAYRPIWAAAMKKVSDPSSGFTLSGEAGKQSQKVHRRHRNSPIHFLALPNRQHTGEISPTAYFSDPLSAVVNGITPINSTATGPIRSSAALFLHQAPPTTNHHHQSLIVVTVKLNQITITIRNDLAVSVVIENSQLVVNESNLIPIGN
jgi:hypothetical protein